MPHLSKRTFLFRPGQKHRHGPLVWPHGVLRVYSGSLDAVREYHLPARRRIDDYLCVMRGAG